MRLKLKLKTADYPSAVARDFLLAADSAIPLCDSLAPEQRVVNENVRILDELVGTEGIIPLSFEQITNFDEIGF